MVIPAEAPPGLLMGFGVRLVSHISFLVAISFPWLEVVFSGRFGNPLESCPGTGRSSLWVPGRQPYSLISLPVSYSALLSVLAVCYGASLAFFGVWALLGGAFYSPVKT